jgi:3-amino-4-hydroxybenzoic acid synthase
MGNRNRKLCWLDIRSADGARQAIAAEAVHQRLDGVVAARAADLAGLPPTIRKILLLDAGSPWTEVGGADVVIVPWDFPERAKLADAHPHVELGCFIEVGSAASLAAACAAARSERWCVLRFTDPTKIPLEIVIAAAAGAEGMVIAVAQDAAEARILFGVLELGADGVMMPGLMPGDATALGQAAQPPVSQLALTELRVTAVSHLGMGERACVDTCSYLEQDEGILAGSHSKGLMLCVSETHPLPYMPTRPFRVNAGAIHSYTLASSDRTCYLSELKAGGTVLAVNAGGRARVVSVGRVKIERRPLICVAAVAPNGQDVNLVLQDDWHVRVLGPEGAVLNCTELAPGDAVLGYLPTADRHVGYPIDEFCVEQ